MDVLGLNDLMSLYPKLQLAFELSGKTSYLIGKAFSESKNIQYNFIKWISKFNHKCLSIRVAQSVIYFLLAYQQIKVEILIVIKITKENNESLVCHAFDDSFGLCVNRNTHCCFG